MRSIFGISAEITRRASDARGVAPGTGPVCRLFKTLIGTLLWVFAGAAAAGAPYPFDDSGYLGSAALMPDWSATMLRQYDQAELLRACLQDPESCPRHYRGLRHLLLKADSLSAEQQVKLINHYINRKRYRSDRSARLDTDLVSKPVKYKSRWSTVEEFMRRGGDCEDYATTKYYLLRQLGFPIEHLRVVVTWDRAARGYHGILAVKLNNEVWLLESDNTIRRGRRHTYRFIYSLNENSIWDHEAQASLTRTTHQQPIQQEEEPAA